MQVLGGSPRNYKRVAQRQLSIAFLSGVSLTLLCTVWFRNPGELPHDSCPESLVRNLVACRRAVCPMHDTRRCGSLDAVVASLSAGWNTGLQHITSLGPMTQVGGAACT